MAKIWSYYLLSMIHSSQFKLVFLNCANTVPTFVFGIIIILYYIILQHLLLPHYQLGALVSALLEIDLYYDRHTFVELLIIIRGKYDSSV